ncbi:glycoside hydrolase superfamily [Elsinoe ampelina]|uniref:beta-galactosidase n=1 Tax=Elsinoe ampelina TaxID=302913 RepID=A0A6A6GC29_9PEZI|nr:glycoside hydrolase superfamily [Elsinoe ampelina]
MKLVSLLLGLLPLLAQTQKTNNLTDLVAWDPYSLYVQGERVFIYSGEFHYQRLPVPELWLDVFQKFKANGFNTISVYFFWSFHSPVRDVYDFESGAKDVQRMLDYAKQAGLYVIARAGPYNNAETSGGGFALYLGDGSGGRLRTNDAKYYAQWQPWIAKIGKIIAANEITNGGPIILTQVENELTQTRHIPDDPLVLYMEQAKKAYRDAGVLTPFTHNEKGMRGQSWSVDYQNVGGAVDVYGLDSYPGGTDCARPAAGYNVVRTYYQWFQNYSFSQPEFTPEFAGGWFQPWGGYDYNDCPSTLSPRFPDLYYKNNIGQKMVLQNLYMAFGGTNWGHSAAPVVFTSYDYSAALRETRQVRDKLSHNKLIGLFTRVSSGLLRNDMEGNGTAYTSNAAVFTWSLRNAETGAGFYILNQNRSTSQDSVTTNLDVETSAGAFTLTNINLNGRQSKIIVTDYPLTYSTLLYSSTDIATFGTFGERDVVVLYAEAGQTSSFAFKDTAPLSFEIFGATVDITIGAANTTNTTTSYTYSQPTGYSVVSFNNGPLFYLFESPAAYRFFAPPTTSNPNVLPSEQIFVVGPYLVRSASLNDGVVSVIGDNDDATTIEVYAGAGATTITWNGQALETTRTPYGALTAALAGPAAEASVDLPSLGEWRSADSFPEVSPDYDDSAWTVCDRNTTQSPVRPITLPVLFASDYGYHAGIRIYRGRFDGTNVTGANLTASGGLAFGWNIYLNGALIGTELGNPSNTTTSLTVSFSGQDLQAKDNLLTVLIDYSGHDQTSTAQGVANPRGLLGATLQGGVFTSWKLQGNAGGAQGAYDLDPVRAPMNEGGLLAERLGWHLPGFDPATNLPDGKGIAFSAGSPVTDGVQGSGVRYFFTDVALDLPDGHDIPLSVQLTASKTTKARIQLFVNGYQFGKFVPHIGPQTVFPVPEGILNHRGNNRIGLTIWSQTNEGAKLDDIKLVRMGAYSSGFAAFKENRLSEGLQPGWTAERLQYA